MIAFPLVVLLGGFVLAMIVVLVVLLLVVVKKNTPPPRSVLPPRTDGPMRAERMERISREIEKINAMETAGRISAEEAAELRAALEGERREWTEKCAEFARESGAAAAGLARKRLTKSRNAVLAGVCGGLAEWMGVDATLVRVGYVLLTLFTSAFPGLILYLVLWIILPLPEAAAATVAPSTVTPVGKSGAGKGLAVFLICLLAVPLVLVVLAGMWFVGAKRSAVVRHEQDSARFQAQCTERAKLAEQQAEQTLLACIVKNRPAHLTPAHRLYGIVLSATSTTDIPRVRTALEADKLCFFDGTSSDSFVANQEEVFRNGGGTLTIWLWSSLPENGLRDRLNGLKLPPGCAFADLRVLSGAADNASPVPAAAAASAASENP